jgi:hypothetical protein
MLPRVGICEDYPSSASNSQGHGEIHEQSRTSRPLLCVSLSVNASTRRVRGNPTRRVVARRSPLGIARGRLRNSRDSLAEFTLSGANVLGMTLQLGSGQAFQVRLLRFAGNDHRYVCSCMRPWSSISFGWGPHIAPTQQTDHPSGAKEKAPEGSPRGLSIYAEHHGNRPIAFRSAVSGRSNTCHPCRRRRAASGRPSPFPESRSRAPR